MGGVKPPPMPDDVSRASESEETGGLLAEASDAFKTQTPTDRLIAALKVRNACAARRPLLPRELCLQLAARVSPCAGG